MPQPSLKFVLAFAIRLLLELDFNNVPIRKGVHHQIDDTFSDYHN